MDLRKKRNLIWVLAFLFLFIIPSLLSLYGDLLWFISLNFSTVFWTILKTKIFLWIITATLFFLFVTINLRIAIKYAMKKNDLQATILNKFIKIATVFLAILIGFAFSSKWEVLLQYFNPTLFALSEEVFAKDIAFYVFKLPFLILIKNFIFSTIFLTLLVLLVAYLFYTRTPRKEVILEENRIVTDFRLSNLQQKSIKHISILWSFLLLSIAFWFFLEKYKILLSIKGVVFGAAYTDINIFLPFYMVLLVLSLAAAVYFFLYKSTNFKPISYSLSILFFLLLVGAGVSYIVQSFIVEPDEFNLEKEYISRNIKHTTEAYGLFAIEEKEFPTTSSLTLEDIKNNKATIENIRLWDWRPLLSTYKQLQLFRTYYDFVDVDVDRYTINNNYKQVMISARELNQDQLPEKAKTWINKHLVYTHGYGLAMSPVNEISEEGLPNFYIKDIPPKSITNANLKVTQPEIYYGQETNDFIIVKTTTNELDYPSGEKNIYTVYKGGGGIPLDTFLKRLAYSVKFNSLKLLVSGSVQKTSKILFSRNIVERAHKIAPFLEYDPDPYLVIADNKLYWILDAYTITNTYPYSEPVNNDINYIRNSVKVVVDAYNGAMDFYIIENEPIIQTYQKIFPSLFKNFAEMPENLQEHIRYPEGLLKIQSLMYATYHMKDPQVFYNREDTWSIPNELYRGSSKVMEPYYIVMKLPEQEKEEFILITPFVPKGKENMIAWMAARSDSPHYGKLVVFKFSKQELIYGPMQIEARIDQNTDISQKFTLWDQRGSDVIRGNLLVIPIENSILYVEPVYLQASAAGALPELKRVIVAFGNKVTMQETLEEALNTIFLGEQTVEKIEEAMKEQKPSLAGEITDNTLLATILSHYRKSQVALKQGDFTIYAEEINIVGELLEDAYSSP